MNAENRRVVDPEAQVSDAKSSEACGGRVAATKRLQKELCQFVMHSDKSITAFPDGDNLFRWIATITGPKDTVFEGLKFKLLLTFPVKYPFCAPVVLFLNHCFHPNISSDGDICLDILKDKWTALYDVRTVLISIQSLLGEPNLDSPLDSCAADMWGRQDYRQIVLEKYRKSVNDSTKSK